MRVYCAFDLSWNVLHDTMPRPYSDYLRWRIVYQRLFYLKSQEEIALQFRFVCPKLFTGRLTTFGMPVHAVREAFIIVLVGPLVSGLYDCHNCSAFFEHLKYSFMK